MKTVDQLYSIYTEALKVVGLMIGEILILSDCRLIVDRTEEANESDSNYPSTNANEK